jgi:hypothetical protein
MDPKDKSILTEDGQRLTIKEGEITGTEDSGPGLGYETGSTLLNEAPQEDKDKKPNDACNSDE